MNNPDKVINHGSYFLQQRGFSILEMFLCITVLAVVLGLGFGYQHLAQQQGNVAQVTADLGVISRALDSYYHQTGCYSGATQAYGVFSGSLCNPLAPDTTTCPKVTDPKGLNLGANYQSRPPLISGYQAGIQNTGAVTGNGRPLYRLVILAQLNSIYNNNSNQTHWYQQQLSANSVISYNGNQYLMWSAWPINNAAQPGNAYWVLNGWQQYFRQQQTIVDTTDPTPSANYCAN